MNANVNFGYAALTCAVLCLLYSLGYVMFSSIESYSRWSALLVHPPSTGEYMIAAVADRNMVCSIVLVTLFPSFPMFYFAQFFGFINSEVNMLGISFMNFISKVLFALVLMDGHTEVI